MAQTSSGASYRGPVARDYLVRDTVPLTTLAWSRCSRVAPINVNTQVRLTVPGAQQGQITTDSIDGKVRQILGFQFRRC